MKSLNHLHSYVKAKKYFNELHYRCDHPDCGAMTSVTRLLGKRAICSICHNQEIILDKKQLKLAKPHCLECSKSPKDRAAVLQRQKISSVLDEVLLPLEVREQEEEDAR